MSRHTINDIHQNAIVLLDETIFTFVKKGKNELNGLIVICLVMGPYLAVKD